MTDTATSHFIDVLNYLEQDGVEIQGRGELLKRLGAAGEAWPQALVDVAMGGRHDGMLLIYTTMPRRSLQDVVDGLARFGLTPEQRDQLVKNIPMTAEIYRAFTIERHRARAYRLAIIGAVSAVTAALPLVGLFVFRNASFSPLFGVLAAIASATTIVLAVIFWRHDRRRRR